MVTDDYQGSPKGRVRPVFGKTPVSASRVGGMTRRPEPRRPNCRRLGCSSSPDRAWWS